MEAVGLAASLIGIAGVVKTLIDLYDIVSDVRYAPQDLVQLLSHFQLQRVNFFLWCQHAGITNLVLLQNSNHPGARQNDKFSSQIQPDLLESWILKVIEETLGNVHDTFRTAQKLLDTYTTRRNPSFLARLIERQNGTDGSMNEALVNFIDSNADPELSYRHKPPCSMSIAQRATWTMHDKKKFTEFLRSLQMYNQALENILSKVERIRLIAQRELIATTSSLAEVISSSKNVDQASYTVQAGMKDMHRLVELSKRAPHITETSTERSLAKGTNSLDLATLSPSLDLRLLQSDCFIPESGIATMSPTRIYGTWKNQPVLIEWKYYSPQEDSDGITRLSRRVALLSLQLQQSAQTRGFNILQCQGYIHQIDEQRLGVVFKLPTTPQHASMISLQDRLLQDRKSRVIRDLGARFSVARALVMTLFRLHSVGWLHKNFRSENILFLESNEYNNHDLGTPYICGFDSSRPDMRNEMSESIPASRQRQYLAKERMLYYHPDRHTIPEVKDSVTGHRSNDNSAAQNSREGRDEFRFKKSHDTYSLGIVMLEIGLWCPIAKLAESHSPLDFHTQKLPKLLPELRYRMGKRYFDVVDRCLKGNFAELGSNEDSENYGAQSRRWLESFLANAVDVLESVTI